MAFVRIVKCLMSWSPNIKELYRMNRNLGLTFLLASSSSGSSSISGFRTEFMYASAYIRHTQKGEEYFSLSYSNSGHSYAGQNII